MTDASDRLAATRALVTVATQRLVGDTIGVNDPSWCEPSRLPHWSRGHVATHLARNADGMRRLTEWARTGERHEMYASAQVREEEIEAGAGRSGLELQIDLDTSAERLTEGFSALDEADAWEREVELRGGQRLAARLLPVARLTEVVLHHVDLDIGYEVSDIDNETADFVLEWSAHRLGVRDEFPRLQLRSDTGLHTDLGGGGSPRTVTGSSSALLGWLTGRATPDTVRGAGDLVLPGL